VLLCLGAGCGSGSGADIEYVALGASDAAGIGATPLTNGYVYRIQAGIEERGKDVELENLGIPGAKIGNIDDFEIVFLRRDKPSLVTLFTGPNDLVSGDDPVRFESDLNELLKKIIDGSGPDLVLAVANIPDLTKLPTFVSEPDADVTPARIQAYNAAIKRQTLAVGGILVDLNATPVSPSLVNDDDGFHPNDAGHQAIADEFLRVVAPVLFP